MIATRLYIVCAALLVASVSVRHLIGNAATRACAKGFTQWCVTPPPKRDDLGDLADDVFGSDGTLGADGDVFGTHGTVGEEGPVFGTQDITGANGPVANALNGDKRDPSVSGVYEGVTDATIGEDGLLGDTGALFGEDGIGGRKGPIFGGN